VESMLGRAILTSRWLLAVFFLGLVLGLAAFAVRFLHKLWKMVVSTFVGEDTDLLIALLHLVDYALVASLVVMVALASWDSLVDRLQGEADEQEMRWVSRTDHSNLKIKVATAIVAISSIEMLQMFLQIDRHQDRDVIWRVVIHMVFLTGAVMLGVLDRIGRRGSTAKNEEA